MQDSLPSTNSERDSQEYENYYQKHLLSETYVPQTKFSISSNIFINQQQEIKKIEGWLLKKSPKLLVGWQKRYVKLQDGKLLYYKNKDQFKGCVDFHLVNVQLDVTYKNGSIVEIRLELIGANKRFQFKDPENKNLENWFRCLKFFINDTQDCPKSPMILNQVWRHERISQKNFKHLADTGDILLFKGNTTINKLQRVITGDDFDHVAILLRYNNGELFLFEAMGQTGVSLLNWEKFLQNKWHLLYKKLVFRHLDIDRDDDLIGRLEKFIKNAIGKRYKMSPSKIIKRFSNSNEDISDYDKEDKTFFCSELVAAAYKRMGILTMDRCAASYWPGIFSQKQKQKLQLIKGELQQELLIDFSINE